MYLAVGQPCWVTSMDVSDSQPATTSRPHDAGKGRESARNDEKQKPSESKEKRPGSLILRRRAEAASDLYTAEVTRPL